MNPRDPWGREVFWFLLLAGILDRLVVLARFGTQYIGTDDAIIWSAAMDYGRGAFHEPYFYGQDYGPMLEALIAAPFARAGATLRILMPTVTTILAMLPYWSFAFWNRRQGRATAACVFLAMPVLLPPEYGLMTTVTRGWVTGIGLLAFLPWAQGMRRCGPRSVLVGLSASLACLMNPNVLPFVAAFTAFHLFTEERPLRYIMGAAIGAFPASMFHLGAQAYCAAHPERVRNTLFDWRLEFHPQGMMDGLANLGEHFAWLMPLAWPLGQLIGVSILALTIVALGNGRKPLAAALITAMAIVLLSFAFAKVHDGVHNVFLPLSRVFLALPFIGCWGLAELIADAAARPWAARALAASTLCVLVIKTDRLPGTIDRQLREQGPWSSEQSLARMNDDFNHVRNICGKQHVGLIMPLDIASDQVPQYRTVLYPALAPDLPPAWFHAKDNRYWMREAFHDSAVADVLLIAGRGGTWDRRARGICTAIDLSRGRTDRYLLLQGNKLPMDSLVNYLLAP